MLAGEPVVERGDGVGPGQPAHAEVVPVQPGLGAVARVVHDDQLEVQPARRGRRVDGAEDGEGVELDGGGPPVALGPRHGRGAVLRAPVPELGAVSRHHEPLAHAQARLRAEHHGGEHRVGLFAREHVVEGDAHQSRGRRSVTRAPGRDGEVLAAVVRARLERETGVALALEGFVRAERRGDRQDPVLIRRPPVHRVARADDNLVLALGAGGELHQAGPRVRRAARVALAPAQLEAHVGVPVAERGRGAHHQRFALAGPVGHREREPHDAIGGGRVALRGGGAALRLSGGRARHQGRGAAGERRRRVAAEAAGPAGGRGGASPRRRRVGANARGGSGGASGGGGRRRGRGGDGHHDRTPGGRASGGSARSARGVLGRARRFRGARSAMAHTRSQVCFLSFSRASNRRR